MKDENKAEMAETVKDLENELYSHVNAGHGMELQGAITNAKLKGLIKETDVLTFETLSTIKSELILLAKTPDPFMSLLSCFVCGDSNPSQSAQVFIEEKMRKVSRK